MNTAASTTSRTTRRSRLVLALATVAWLAACGGGSGGAPSESTPDASHAEAPGNADGSGAMDDVSPAPATDLGDGGGDRSLALTWEAPLTNEDGSPLNDLAGYRIYYGSRSGSYGASVAVNNPAAVSHRLESLAPGTYYVVVKAVNSAGAQSIASPEASKTIQ